MISKIKAPADGHRKCLDVRLTWINEIEDSQGSLAFGFAGEIRFPGPLQEGGRLLGGLFARVQDRAFHLDYHFLTKAIGES